MFVKSKRFGRNPKTNFIYDKELPAMGSKSERLVLPFSERLDNPKVGNSAYKNFFQMSKEKTIVAEGTVCIQVTPAQQKLLKLISHVEAEDYFTSLKQVHYLGTYCVDKDMVELWQNGYVHNLLDAIQEIKQEHFVNNLKTA